MRTEQEMPRSGLDVAPEDAGPGEIAGYVEANRAALDRTLSELEKRMAPQAVFDMAIDRLRHGGGAEYVRGLRDSIVRNPLPVTLTAVGIAWTMFADRHPDDGAPSRGGNGGSHLRHAREGLKETGEAITSRAKKVRERGHGWFEHGRGSVHSAQSRASAWGSATAERSRESAARAEAFSREHPLIVAGAGLTIGAVLAALLPSTRTEDEYLGPARDRFVEQAEDTMDEWSESAGETVNRVSESARQAVSESGEAPGQDASGISAGPAEAGELHPPTGIDQGPGTSGGTSGGVKPPEIDDHDHDR